MGISIHYSGTLNADASIEALIEELADIAKSMSWQAIEVRQESAEEPPFTGLILNPSEGCEPLCFIIDPDRRLRALADLITRQVEPDPRCSYTHSVKTQFTKIETHIWITHLLRYLGKTYFQDLHVVDEGDYWQTSDVELLAEKRRFLQSKIDQLAGGLNQLDEIPKDIDQLIAKIEQILEAKD